MTAPATTPTGNFLRVLLEERVVPVEFNSAEIVARLDAGRLTQHTASAMITTMKAQPRVGNDDPVTEPGIYERDSYVVKVQLNREKTRLYAKRLIDGRWDYAPGLIGKVRASDAITLARAIELSNGMAACIRCGATLTNPKSVNRFMGPVCVTYFS